jgi:uncharacterized protein
MTRARVWPVFVGFVLAAVVVLVAAGVMAVVESRATGQALTEFKLTASNLTASAAVTGAILLLATLAFARPLTRARLRLVRGRGGLETDVAASLGAVALAQVLDSLTRLAGVFPDSTLAKFEQAMAGASGPLLLLALVMVGPVTGFIEELFFRGFMQTRLAERWRPWVAVLVTSICFGLFHLDPVHAVVAFGLGLWLGFVSVRADSLRPAVVAHVVNNLLATGLAAAGIVASGTPLTIGLGGAGLLVFAGCAVYLLRVPAAAAGASVSLN